MVGIFSPSKQLGWLGKVASVSLVMVWWVDVVEGKKYVVEFNNLQGVIYFDWLKSNI